MSTSTPNFNLTKPAGSENVDIATINSNMDKIDAGVEPIHKIYSVSGSNGCITISDAMSGPLASFTAQGILPQVFSAQGMGAQMGEQDWDNPMLLDVPLGIIDANGDALVISYGNGAGNSNTWSINSGEDIGTNVYYTSKDIINLFNEADDEGGTVTNEGNGYRLFACPLPFSVAENSLVYCSHLKNQNVSGEEGIWASGNTLYLRITDTHSGGDEFAKLAAVIEQTITSKCNYFAPMSPVGMDPVNFFDFFIDLTASASYTKQSKKFALSLDNGTSLLAYLKLSDYIGILTEMWQPDPAPIPAMGAMYYANSIVNALQAAAIELAVRMKFEGPAALGSGAVAENGGAVGIGAMETYGGGAVGYGAKAATGGAVGVNASSISGQGGAVGMNAAAYDGGAVGYGATTSQGCAIGRYAECKDSHGDPIDAIQLGSGTNRTPRSMKVYNTELLTSSGYIPLSLIILSYQQGTDTDKATFLAIGDSKFAVKANSYGGFAGGTAATATDAGGAIGNGASATTGGAVGNRASATTGGAIGEGATATIGFAGGTGASTSSGVAIGNGATTDIGVAIGNGSSLQSSLSDGSAVGLGALAARGGAIGYHASSANGGAIGYQAIATQGGAVGTTSQTYAGAAVGEETYSVSGGALGYHAYTVNGCAVGNESQSLNVAIGNQAKCLSGNNQIDAIQLGTGTNSTVKSMQVYGTQLLYYHSTDDTHYIPLSLITASYSKADPTDQALFKQALGIS